LLAQTIVSMYFDKITSQQTLKDFENIVQKGGSPKIVEKKIKKGSIVLEAVASLVGSKSQAKRLLKSEAIEIDGKVIKEAKKK